MKILMFGDVVGEAGTACFQRFAPRLKQQYAADLIVVNGENSAKGNGITQQSADQLFAGGADIITTGNHCFRRKCDEIFENPRILRPANYPEGAPGSGVCILDCGAYSFAVINLMGTAFMEGLDNPFTVIDTLLEEIDTPNILVDFHAEATSEKRAMGWYLAGRVSAVIGTHTHVQTADEQILGGHTGYITDVGFTGARNSVLGIDKDVIIARLTTYYPQKHTYPDGDIMINAVLIGREEKSGKCTHIERINICENK